MGNSKWVAGFGVCESVITQAMSDIFADTTHRYNIFTTVDGTGIRLHYSNKRGLSRVTVDGVFVAIGKNFDTSEIDTATTTRVTFGGKNSLTLDPGESAVSDEIPLTFHAGDTISVSQYFEGVTELRAGHSLEGKFVKKFLCRGNYTESATLPSELIGVCSAYVLFCGADFLASDDCEAIVAFGDSITARPWPDYLARRIFDLGIRNRTVVRKGIGGSRVLRTYTCRAKIHWGEAGVARFERDICQPGVTKVILLHGINDIIHPVNVAPYCGADQFPTVEEVIEGYKYYIDTAHKHGMKIYQGTLLPCTHPYMKEESLPRRETLNKLNEWIRTSGESDGVIEFGRALANPANPDEMLPEYTVDDLHPSLLGASLMAQTVPVEFIK